MAMVVRVKSDPSPPPDGSIAENSTSGWPTGKISRARARNLFTSSSGTIFSTVLVSSPRVSLSRSAGRAAMLDHTHKGNG